MKIAHLSSAHPDRDTRIFLKECVSLAKADYEVHLVLAGVEERTEMGVRVHSVKKGNGSRLNRALKTVNAVYQKALELDADIYHLHDPELLRIGTKLIRKGKKVVYDAHEDMPRQVLDKFYLKFRKTISKIAERYENRAAKKMTGIVTATPYIRDRFLKINPNTIDINNYPILSELLIEAKDSSSKGICYVGGLTTIRGVKQMLDALNESNEKMIWAGKFESEQLEKDMKNHANWSKIDFRGFVSREEVRDIYGSCDIGLVLLHPAHNHITSQPIKMFEYMAAGLVVIASDFPYWKKIVEDGQCGICVDPMHPEKIHEAIQSIRTNPALVAQMRENGQQLVREKYNWAAEETKLINWYKKL